MGEIFRLPKENELVRKVRDPRLPSKEYIDVHYLKGQILYRDWCPVCVRAMGRDMRHFMDKEKKMDLSEYSWDFGFPGNELEVKWMVLVGNTGAQMVMATAIPFKWGEGASGH